jgi:hypothetical protein
MRRRRWRSTRSTCSPTPWRRSQDKGEAQQSLRWAVQIHMRAVTAVRPDPTALAERLFTWAVADEWSVFADAVSDYAEPLGSVGRARLRELIDEELDRLPRLGPDETGGERRHSVLTLAERVARPDGVDAVVDVLSYSLTSARAFTRICRELIEAGQPEQALRWAERGLSECGTGLVDPRPGRAAPGRRRPVRGAWPRSRRCRHGLAGLQGTADAGGIPAAAPARTDRRLMARTTGRGAGRAARSAPLAAPRRRE